MHRGNRANIVNASLTKSPLWKMIEIKKLTKNMRLVFKKDEEQSEF